MIARIETKLHAFLNSRLALLVYTVIASLAAGFSLEHYITPLFVVWLMFVLVVEKNFLNSFLLLVLICGNVLRTLGQTSANLEHVWLAVPIVIGILISFILYRRKIRLGGRRRRLGVRHRV